MYGEPFTIEDLADSPQRAAMRRELGLEPYPSAPAVSPAPAPAPIQPTPSVQPPEAVPSAKPDLRNALAHRASMGHTKPLIAPHRIRSMPDGVGLRHAFQAGNTFNKPLAVPNEIESASSSFSTGYRNQNRSSLMDAIRRMRSSGYLR